MTGFRNPLLNSQIPLAKLQKDIDALIKVEKKSIEAAYREIERMPTQFGNSVRETLVDAAQKREGEIAHLEALKKEFFDSAQEISEIIEKLCERLFERRGYEDRPATQFAKQYSVFQIRNELQGEVQKFALDVSIAPFVSNQPA